MRAGLRVICALLTSDFNQNWNPLTHFSKAAKYQNFIQIRSALIQFLHPDNHNEANDCTFHYECAKDVMKAGSSDGTRRQYLPIASFDRLQRDSSSPWVQQVCEPAYTACV
jgi:hypothetical protein